MRSAPWIALTGLLIASIPNPSEACGRRHRCRCFQPRPVPYAAYHPPVAYAAPQATPYQAVAVAAAAPVAAAPASTPTVADVQPTYNYTAPSDGQPAYYYTYDSSGKLVVTQWMDWLFRGGRAAGEPAPPLPIIGALRGR